MILVDIGEVGVKVGADHYRLRPSLYAVSQMGTPTEIVEIYGRLMGEAPTLADALHVIYCCSEDDLSHVFGALVPDGDRLKFETGAASFEDTVHIARSLIRHGVTGALPPEERTGEDEQEGDYVTGFDARGNAAMAMAHLGASSESAWRMTMTELVGALRAKFPRMPEIDAKTGKPKSKRMTEAEYDAVMDYGDAIMAALAAKEK